jgi:ubiquinone/menaquinone biosynthesis C-methylase UbiE
MGSSRLEHEVLRIWSQLKKVALRARIGQRWGRSEGEGGLARRVYPDYDTYLDHQSLKLDALRAKSLAGHDRRFHAALTERLEHGPLELEGKSVLCLAARMGTEVRVFIDRGAFAVGVDLNPGKDNRWVVAGDFHALQYADDSADLVYTNSLDHVYDLERVVTEVRRVLKPGGIFVVELGMGSDEGGGAGGFYEALSWERTDALLERIASAGFGLRYRTSFDLPWKGVQAALEKPGRRPSV